MAEPLCGFCVCPERAHEPPTLGPMFGRACLNPECGCPDYIGAPDEPTTVAAAGAAAGRHR